MKHKRFTYQCPNCNCTGLQSDPKSPYKVRVCATCGGFGKARLTVQRRIELDRQLGGINAKSSR